MTIYIGLVDWVPISHPTKQHSKILYSQDMQRVGIINIGIILCKVLDAVYISSLLENLNLCLLLAVLVASGQDLVPKN
jgi:hypothetical protein